VIQWSGLRALLVIGCLLPASIQAQTRLKVEGETYDSLEQAETALRAKTAAEIAKMPAQTDTPYGSLLLVMAAEKPPKLPDNLPPGMANPQMLQAIAATSMFTRIGYSADADALRQSKLFSEVEFLRADDVAESDFRGAAYKIYAARNIADPLAPAAFVKVTWTLARADGTSVPLATEPTAGLPKVEWLRDWVAKVKVALEAVSPR